MKIKREIMEISKIYKNSKNPIEGSENRPFLPNAYNFAQYILCKAL
jgi:hypothetical protein